ncbi:MAG: CoA transferase, partial [Aquabacterium sp.]
MTSPDTPPSDPAAAAALLNSPAAAALLHSPAAAALLCGITVLEQPASVAARYAGRLLAACGATVWQLGAPDNRGVGYGGAATEAYAAWLDAGKRRTHAAWQDALDTVGSIDLLLAGPDAADVDAADAALRGLAAPPLRLGLTWFAGDGPYRHWRGDDALLQALSGVAYSTGPVDGAPLLPRGHATQVVAGTTALIAALGALLGRRRGAHTRRIDVDMLSANLCFYEGTTCAAAPLGDQVLRRGLNRFTPTYPGGIWATADGWIGLTALTPPQWAALCAMAGLDDLADVPHYQVALNRLNDADALDARLGPALRQRPSAWWLEQGQRQRIPFAPVPTLAELPATPHWVVRGSFAPVPGCPGAVGPALPMQIETVGVPAPAAASATKSAASTTAATTPSPATRPLDGLRVLDLSMGWAGPLCARHLADLGADVVKVESCSHMDWWRGFDAMAESDPPVYETRASFLMVNRRKRGITLDLKTADGRALLRRLAGLSDVMVENYAPGTLDKLGVGAHGLAAAVPGLVAVSMGAFGNRGPWSSFRAYGSTVEQASGLPFVNGEPGDAPTMQHVAYGDPVAGLYAAVAALAALLRRDRDRTQGPAALAAPSTYVDLSQVEALFQLGADALVAQSLQPGPLPRQGSAHPQALLRTVLRCQGVGAAAWLALCVQDTVQAQALACLLGCRADALASAAASWAAGRSAPDA